MRLLYEILNDTLKRESKWSRTSLTMFSAWIVALSMSLVDFFKNGLNFEVWFTLVMVSIGVKITDAYSKKINK